NHDLWSCRVYLAVADQFPVHEVEAHRSRIGSADAAELKLVALGICKRHILEALGRFADNFDQRVRAGAVVVSCSERVAMVDLRERGRGDKTEQSEHANQGISE